MSLIIKPKGVDFVIESKPWTDEELAEFRVLMKNLKEGKNAKSPKTASKQIDKNYRTGASA